MRRIGRQEKKGGGKRGTVREREDEARKGERKTFCLRS